VNSDDFISVLALNKLHYTFRRQLLPIARFSDELLGSFDMVSFSSLLRRLARQPPSGSLSPIMLLLFSHSWTAITEVSLACSRSCYTRDNRTTLSAVNFCQSLVLLTSSWEVLTWALPLLLLVLSGLDKQGNRLNMKRAPKFNVYTPILGLIFSYFGLFSPPFYLNFTLRRTYQPICNIA